jgi:hypothetical protein
MMKHYDLYGFVERDLDQVCTILESILHVTFRAHDSLYLGEYYLYKYPKPEHGELSLRINLDPLDGESAETHFPEVTILLYSEDVPAPLALEKMLSTKIPGVRLLRRVTRDAKV